MRLTLLTSLLLVITGLHSNQSVKAQKPCPTPTPCVCATPTPTPTPIPPPPTPTPTPVPTPTPGTTAFLRVFSANLQHGQSTDGSFDYPGQAAQLTARADVIAAQEVSVGDLPNWDAAFASLGYARSHYFANSTLGDGQAFWYKTSLMTLTGTFSKKLSQGFKSFDGSTDVDKSAIAIKVIFNGRELTLYDVHFCWSKCADSQGSTYSTQRVSQINTFLSWVPSVTTSPNRAVFGDMNFAPDYPMNPAGYQIDLFTAAGFQDLWRVGLSTNKAKADWGDRDADGIPDMMLGDLITRTADIRRIDMAFLDGNATNLSLAEIEVPDLRKPCPQTLVPGGAYPQCPSVVQVWDIPEDEGVRWADHNWLLITFAVN